jgi:hypothetical protein
MDSGQEIPEVLFVKDVMRLRRMSRRLVMAEILSGRLRAYENGSGQNKYRIDRADYYKWRR